MEEVYFDSSCGNTKIRGIMWEPKGDVKAILQISHGMAEHILRYKEFAEYLNDCGYLVVGNDHLGHGKSVNSRKEFGHINRKQGNKHLVEDMHLLKTKITSKYPRTPYFMLGHSMGSTLLRQYMYKYGDKLNGAIHLGVVSKQNPILIKIGKGLCVLLGAVMSGKEYHRSTLLYNMTFGDYNKKMKDPKTVADWITSDQDKIQEYVKDPLCNFIFTVDGYYTVFEGIGCGQNKENMSRTPIDLPMFFMAGGEDPVGGFGIGAQNVYEEYKKRGVKEIKLKIYKNCRHELLNEKNRNEVYQDIQKWIADYL